MLFEYRKLAHPGEIKGGDDEFRNPWARAHHDDVGLMSRVGRLRDRLKWGDKHKWNGNRILFLVRDPRDTIHSNYFRIIVRDKRADISELEFFKSERWGIGTLCKWLVWWWEHTDTVRDFKTVRFEDTLEDPARTLGAAVRFFSKRSARRDLVDEAVARSTFDIMRAREEETTTIFKDQGGQIGDDRRTAMVRKGTAGQWRELSDEILDHCESEMRRLLGTVFHYEDGRGK